MAIALYLIVTVMVFIIITISTAETLLIIKKPTKVLSVITMFLIAVFWFPFLIYLTIYSIRKKFFQK